MILPLRVFGSSGVKTMFAGFAIGPIFRDDVVAQLVELLDRPLVAALQRHVRDDRLAGLRVVAAEHRRLRHLGVVDERRSRPRSSRSGARRRSSRRRRGRAARSRRPRRCARRRRRSRRPGTATSTSRGSGRRPCRSRAASPATAAAARGSRRPRLDLVARLVDDGRVDARERPRRRAGLQRRHPRQRRDQDHPGLRLPPRVDDGRAVAADVLAVPDPGLGVDRLADRAEQAQRGEVVLAARTPAPTSCARGSRSARCRGSSTP